MFTITAEPRVLPFAAASWQLNCILRHFVPSLFHVFSSWHSRLNDISAISRGLSRSVFILLVVSCHLSRFRAGLRNFSSYQMGRLTPQLSSCRLCCWSFQCSWHHCVSMSVLERSWERCLCTSSIPRFVSAYNIELNAKGDRDRSEVLHPGRLAPGKFCFVLWIDMIGEANIQLMCHLLMTMSSSFCYFN